MMEKYKLMVCLVHERSLFMPKGEKKNCIYKILVFLKTECIVLPVNSKYGWMLASRYTGYYLTTLTACVNIVVIAEGKRGFLWK